MTTKKYYQLDADNCFAFAGEAVAFTDDPERYNVPYDAVLIAPPSVPAGSVAQWDGATWQIVEDHRRDTLYRAADVQPYRLGDDVGGDSYNGLGPIPAWLSQTPPVLPPPEPVIPDVVSMRQARLALLGAGLLAQVNTAIDGMAGIEGEAARIEWEYATEVRRDSPLVAGLSAALGLTGPQLDGLFTAAAAIA
jgi:hypothetical protein